MTQKVTQFEGGGGLSYTLRRSRRRTIAVEVHPHGALVVRAPNRTSITEIETFLRSRHTWIAARLAEAKEARGSLPEGTSFLLGRSVDELVSEGFSEGFFEGFSGGFSEGFFEEFSEEFSRRFSRNFSVSSPKSSPIGSPKSSPIGSQMARRRMVEQVLRFYIDALLPALGVSGLRYQKFVVRKMRRRWGSCRADGVLTFNEHLIMVPPRCIKAVVAHELAHLVHLHHGPAFYRLVREIMPDYDEADNELNAWTSVLDRVTGKTNNGAKGPAEQRMLWMDDDQAAVSAQISLNADTSEAAIMSGVRPSMW